MNAPRVFHLSLLFTVLLISVALADQQPAPPPVRDAVGDPSPVAVDLGEPAQMPGAGDLTAADALMAEITHIWQSSQASLAELEARFAAAGDPVTALAIQREIEALHVGTELDILRLQAAHARRQGREADAALLEATIAEALAPVPPEAPATRRTPDAHVRDGR